MQNLEKVKVLTRGESELIAGVCSGLSDYYCLRKNGLRLAFILLSIISFFLPAIVYIVLWLILPKYPSTQAMARHLRRKALLKKSLSS
ncbi:PspC domain-containing protein [Pseudoalteromonas luteoviolacea]|uniref:PspC domain-containing protein n=1 Tax=Pseudoalteromonas luteoviolacea TaxID=43657 RepID=UPI00068BB1D7|nr:PspC domain-containing protein [Pseudoalteromonas luteoviolacea]